MNRVVLGADDFTQLAQQTLPVEVVSPSGQRLGYFVPRPETPPAPIPAEFCRPHTREELEVLRQQTGGRTLDELRPVLAALGLKIPKS
jgi:hypothetical protein